MDFANFQRSKLLQRYPQLEGCRESLALALHKIIKCYQNNGKLLIMGNGGSSADAEHFCGELVKGFTLKRNLAEPKKKIFEEVDFDLANQLQYGFSAFSLGVSHSLISAAANDTAWDIVFAQQVFVHANPNDLVFAISTSGNSKNVVNALKVAKVKKIPTISLTGQRPSMCSELSEVTIRVPKIETHEIQELHLPIYHALAIELEHHFYAE